jgi:hypothetical protein
MEDGSPNSRAFQQMLLSVSGELAETVTARPLLVIVERKRKEGRKDRQTWKAKIVSNSEFSISLVESNPRSRKCLLA